MMKIIICLAAVAVVAGVDAQTFFPMKKGTVLEYKFYDNKEKPLRDAWREERFLRLTVDKVWGDSIANVTIENETFKRLASNKTAQNMIDGISYGDVIVRAEEVVFENVLWLFMPGRLSLMSGDGKSDESFNIELHASAKLPRKLQVGDLLPDMRYEAHFREQVSDSLKAIRDQENETISLNKQLISMGMETIKYPSAYNLELKATVHKRKVDGMESIKTTAGEFECYRISYEIVGPKENLIGYPKMVSLNSDGRINISYEDNDPPVIIKYVDYISPEVGLVKREKLNFRGNKVDETMVLTMISDH